MGCRLRLRRRLHFTITDYYWCRASDVGCCMTATDEATVDVKISQARRGLGHRASPGRLRHRSVGRRRWLVYYTSAIVRLSVIHSHYRPAPGYPPPVTRAAARSTHTGRVVRRTVGGRCDAIRRRRSDTKVRKAFSDDVDVSVQLANFPITTAHCSATATPVNLSYVSQRKT